MKFEALDKPNDLIEVTEGQQLDVTEIRKSVK